MISVKVYTFKIAFDVSGLSTEIRLPDRNIHHWVWARFEMDGS